MKLAIKRRLEFDIKRAFFLASGLGFVIVGVLTALSFGGFIGRYFGYVIGGTLFVFGATLIRLGWRMVNYEDQSDQAE
jgi:hypothetical protein